MQLNIPKITAKVDLGEYAPELAGTALVVWVNPPKKLFEEYDRVCISFLESLEQASAETDGELLSKLGERIRNAHDQINASLAELWSAGPEETRWTAEELQQLEDSDTDPKLLPWMVQQTMLKIAEHRLVVKKKVNRAIEDIGRTGGTSEPLMRDVILARNINMLLGGAVIAPWQIGELPDTEIDRIVSLADISAYRKHYQQVDDIREKWRNSHPSYRRVH